MAAKKISIGVVHKMLPDLRKILVSDAKALAVWEDITPLARNEYLCWIGSAKKEETRAKRVEWARDNLLKGKRRPCCWPGCPHR